MTAQEEIGPRMPSRMEVYRTAGEVEQLARLAPELSAVGPRQDMPRARQALERARALLGHSTCSGRAD